MATTLFIISLSSFLKAARKQHKMSVQEKAEKNVANIKSCHERKNGPEPGLTLPLAIVAICYKKCRVATNISHWIKVHSRWFQNYISEKKCILISFWIFQYCFYYSFTLYYCAIFNSLNAGSFQLPLGCQFGS